MNHKGADSLVIVIIAVMLVLQVSSDSTVLTMNKTETSVLTQSYTAHAPIIIDGNADFLTQDASEDWPGDGSEGDPIIISGYSFAAAEWMLRVENSDIHFQFIDNQLDGISQIWCGVAIVNSANGVIKDNYVIRAAAAIHVVTVENFIIEGNEVVDSPFGGIIVEDGSENVIVKNNIVHDNDNYGIHIGNPYGSTTSHNITIIGNTVYQNAPGGIILLEAENCIVENNEIYDHSLKGILVETGSHRIDFNNVTDCQTGINIIGGNVSLGHNSISDVEFGITIVTDNNTLSENYITNCEEIGLRFYYSYSEGAGGSNNIITGNVFANNTRSGLDFSANANDNLVQNNYFFMNGGTCQANDDGEDNNIDANYWDDWTAPDVNNDSIVDAPYPIEGDASNSDLHPMAIPDRSIPPWYTEPCNCGNETTTTEIALPFDPLLLTLGGSAVVIILIVVAFMKKR